MPVELPFAPQAVNYTNVNPTETFVSEFTGYTQQISSEFSFWRGDILFPPVRRTKADEFRSWIAALQVKNDPTVWIPINAETFGNDSKMMTVDRTAYTDANLGRIQALPLNDQIIIDTLEDSDAQFDKVREAFSPGKTIQLFHSSTPDISYLRTIVACSFPDERPLTIEVCFDRRMPFFEFRVEYGNPKVRAQFLGSENFAMSYDRDGVARLPRMQWQEAVGFISQELREL